ncbi:MAG TPA: YihY/virulence factor BrkB family protein [Kofleriaceae bacterium]|nr:YihY/virulence factor BrkB family protein [Kofleriaceae bacterium]
MTLRDGWELTKETFSEWIDDKASRLAAALAYYTLFSLAPLLIIAIGIAGLVFGEDAARGQVMVQLRGLIGERGAAFLQDLLVASRGTSHGIAATVIGLVVLLFGAAGVFGQLQDALNTIWEVKSRPGRGWRGILQDRFLSFAMVLGTGFLLLVSLTASAAFAAIGTYLSGVLPIPAAALEAVNFGVSFALTAFLFALIFKIVPDAKIAWRDVWIGAGLTAFLFSIGKLLIGIYLGKSSVASTFGAAASPVVLMVWIYYSAQILFLGAEFTQVYATRYGSRIRPARGAILVTGQDD